jgi:sodium pump decarboxylase gamma subunit
MSTISDGLFISIVGLGAVFVILTLIMFLMMLIERLFRSEDADPGMGQAADETPADGEATQGWAEPEGPCEVAAIGLALAHHLRLRGRLIGTSIAINDIPYQLQIGDISRFPVTVVVDGECHRGAVGEDGLPCADPAPSRNEARRIDRQREWNWRTPYQLPQGGCWQPAGWSSRQRTRGPRT